MPIMEEGYPFIFIMNDKTEANGLLIEVLLYHFKSQKSNHQYIVRVEKYANNVYCIKFYDKAVADSGNRYSIRTNTFEPRTIFYTLYHIMLDVLEKDVRASFFFIGAEDENDSLGEMTRRYKVYRKFVSSAITDNLFTHYRVNELSLYILINKNVTVNQLDLVDKICDNVRAAYCQE
jgi:hypothetical protein